MVFCRARRASLANSISSSDVEDFRHSVASGNRAGGVGEDDLPEGGRVRFADGGTAGRVPGRRDVLLSCPLELFPVPCSQERRAEVDGSASGALQQGRCARRPVGGGRRATCLERSAGPARLSGGRRPGERPRPCPYSWSTGRSGLTTWWRRMASISTSPRRSPRSPRSRPASASAFAVASRGRRDRRRNGIGRTRSRSGPRATTPGREPLGNRKIPPCPPAAPSRPLPVPDAGAPAAVQPDRHRPLA